MSQPSNPAASDRPLEYGPPITLDLAKKVMAAAEAEVRANNWPMVVAIVGSGGHLVMLQAFDHAQHGSVVIAEEKARCAVSFKRRTKLMEDAVAKGGLNLRLLAAPGAVPMEGGVPLIADGKIIGGIGVSGMRSTDDGHVAEAAAKAL